jgi:hypothetical protein
MRMIFAFAVATLCFVCSNGCSDPGPSVIKIKDGGAEQAYDLSVAISVGNHTYLPINREDVTPSKMAKEILDLLSEYETAHPDLIVDSWMIEKKQQAHGSTDKVFGIWVNHHKRS